MPNFKALKEALDTCKEPLVFVALSKGEVASKRTALQAFTNGNGFFSVTNLSKLHSVLDGKLLSPVEQASKQELAGSDFETLDELVTMKSIPTDGTVVPELIGVDADVAFALVGEEVYCPITGKVSKLEYHGEIAVDGEEGDDAMDVADDKKPDVDDNSDDSTDGSTTADDDSDDITDVDSDDSSDDDTDDDSGDDTSDDSDDSSDDSDDDEETVSDDDVDFDGEDDSGDDDDSDDDDDTGTDDGSDDDDIEKATAKLVAMKAKVKKLRAAKKAKEEASAKKKVKKVKEVADNDTSDQGKITDGTDSKALLDKYNGSVNIYGTADAVSPMLKGACVKALSSDTFVVSDDEGDTYTVKSSGISDDGNAMKIVGEAKSTESATQEVYASENTDLDVAAVRLLSMITDGNSEVAVFVGPTHIGTLYRTRASETAAPLFADGKKLFAAFRPTLASNYANPKSPELAKYGYVPVQFKVEVAKLFEKRVAYEVSQVKKASETASAAKISDYSSNLELAFVGISKNFFPEKISLIPELAGLLRRAGIQNAETEVRKVIAKSAPNFVKVALEKAKELNNKDAGYLTGIAEGISKATFGETASADNIISTALLDTVRSETAKVPELAGFEEKKPAGNKYDKLVAGISRRY